MKKRKRTLLSILLIVLVFSINSMQSFAMETSFQLPVEIVLEGDRPVKPETFMVWMRALTDNAPMPEQAKDQKVVIEIQGKGKKEFPPMTFTQPGVYRYEIKQQSGGAKQYQYDSCVYTVTVYCTADSAQRLETSVVALEQGKEEVKKEAVRFVNRYEAPKDSAQSKKPVKTGDRAPINILVCMLMMSGFVILFWGIKRYREKRKTEE